MVTSHRRSIEGILPLSPLQHGLLFHALFDPDAIDVYTSQSVLSISGPLDPALMKASAAALMRRHPNLRAIFRYEGLRQPVQVIPQEGCLSWEDLDWSDLSDDEQQRRFPEWLKSDRLRRFDVSAEPSLRWTLVRIAPNRSSLVLTNHHILLDGWSKTTLFRELFSIYDHQGDWSHLPHVAPYRQYLEWVAGMDPEAAIRMWRRDLESLEAGLILFPEAYGTTAETEDLDLELSANVAQRLHECARSHSWTLNTIAQAAWALVLRGIAGRDDVIFGTTVSGRPAELAGVESMVGLLINTLPQRVKLDPAHRLCDLCDRLQMRHAELLPYQHVRLTDLQRLVGVGELFDTLLVFESYPTAEAEARARTSPVRLVGITGQSGSSYPLTLSVIPRQAGIRLRLTYRPDVIQPEWALRIGRQTELALEALASDPSQRVRRVTLMDSGERRTVLVGWNATRQEIPESTIPARISQQAERTPDAVALQHGDQHLTYGALERFASRFSACLRQRGIGPERSVGVSLEASSELAVALLAIWKAGGVYVPLDPSYPVERIMFIVGDAAPSCVITTPCDSGDHAQAEPAESAGCVSFSLYIPGATLPEQVDVAPDANAAPASHATPSTAAYIMYTSGSTGVPKGVVVTHGGLANVITHASRTLKLSGSDVVAAASPIAVDFSLLELLTPWLTGTTVRIIDRSTVLDMAKWVEQLQEVTVLHAMPRLMQQIMDAVADSPCPRLPLRVISTGGDAIPTSTLERMHAVAASARVEVNYGPTETTIICAEAEDARDGRNRGAPMGRPLANIRLYVLNESVEPVPVGCVGELYIAGAGVARGYIGRPALTAARFVADPHTQGGRMYRSGDLVRWNAVGTLAFVGRADQQVKIRGFRVEVEEVERALQAHPDVCEAVVEARSGTWRDRRLIAYVVARAGHSVDPAELRQSLARTLPEYMIPAAVILLDSLPVTPNGKLNRRALPDPDFADQQATYRPPRTPREAIVAGLFSEVLAVKRIGIDDNFFVLGGDSILAIQLVGLARKAGLRVSPRALFQHPTVAGLADAAQPDETAGPRALDDAVGPLPLTPTIREFLSTAGPVNSLYQARWIEVPPGANEGSLRRATQVVLDHHDALRLRLQRNVGNDWSLEVRAEGSVEAAACLERVDLSGVGHSEHMELFSDAVRAAVSRLDAEHGVLVQAVWFDAGVHAASRLFLAVHHLAIDTLSWRILLADLATACNATAAGKRIALGPKGTSFRRWANLLATDAVRPERVSELEHWTSVLHDASLWTEGALSGRADRNAATQRFSLTLPAAVTETILTQVPAAFHAGIDDILLATLALAVSRWRNKKSRTDRRSVVIARESHGRQEPSDDVDLTRTVGWFTSIWPVRLSADTTPLEDAWSGGPALERAVKELKEQLRRTPAEGRGFGLLRYINPSTASILANLPRPQLAFNYLGRVRPDPAAEWSFVPGRGIPNEAPAEPPLPYPLVVNAVTEDGPEGQRLHARWICAPKLLSEGDIAEIATGWFHVLERLAERVTREGGGGRTPSDVPLVSLTQDDIELIERTHPRLGDILPLSPLQRGLLYHGVTAESIDVYTAQMILSLEGSVDVPALQAAARTLLARHPPLRAAFLHDGLRTPVQIVPSEVTLPWCEHDWSQSETAERERRFVAWCDADHSRPFGMAAPPLLRFTLIRFAEREYRLVLTHHHILLDGWSRPLLVNELMSLYERRGEPQTLPSVPSYKHYLAWVAAQDRDADCAVWKSVLAGVDGGTILAPRSASDALIEPQSFAIDWSEEATAPLIRQARAQGWTLSAVLHAAWAIVLGHLTNRDDVVFGSTVSGRPPLLPEVERMIGLFINTLPVRVQLRRSDSIADAVERIQTQHGELSEHHHVSLGDVQRAVGVGTLFDTLVAYENYPLQQHAVLTAGDDLRVTIASGRGAAHFPLSIVGAVTPRLRLRFEYRPDAFSEHELKAIAARVERVLHAIADEPRQLARAIEWLDADERRTIDAVNETAYAVPEGTVLDSFDRQVARTPDAVAIVDAVQHVSYRALHARAAILAQYLREHGVGSEVRVALSLDRTAEMIVAMLAVLRAGGTYIPLDPSYPPERLTFMLDHGKPVITITREHLRARFNRWQGPVCCLDTDWDVIARKGGSNDYGAIHPESAAYAIYTSGSTGQPKATIVSHRSLANSTHARLLYYRDPVSSFLLVSSFAFDSSVGVMYWTLATGGSLIIADERAQRDADDLLAAIRDRSVTHLMCVPSLYRELLNAPDSHLLDLLTTAIVAGEAVTPELVDAHVRVAPTAALYNEYGPTECAVWATVARCNGPAGPDVSIGAPIVNARVYVLDPALRLLPAGVRGELYIGGNGVARGYEDLAAISATAFVADPFGPVGSRMYRTGDFVMRSADGGLRFLGRADEQVKIRGFRVELAEIEAALRACAGVCEAVVLNRLREDGEARLVGYVVTASGDAFDTEATVHSLRERLPEHLVPSSLVTLPAFPLTPSGKVDRARFPEPPRVTVRSSRDTPVTRAEKVFCRLFGDVLRLEELGVEDNFFVLGGDSINAIQLVSRARGAGWRVTARQVFEHPVVRQLAAVAEEIAPARTDLQGQELAALRDRLAGGEKLEPEIALQLIDEVQRVRAAAGESSASRGTHEVALTPLMHWLRTQRRPISRLSQSILVQVPVAMTHVSLVEILQAIIDRHDALRLRLLPLADGSWRLEVRGVGSVRAAACLTRVDLRAIPEGLRDAAREDARRAASARLDPASGVILQAVWFDAGSTSAGQLQLVIHHLAVDGVSWRILAAELAEAWEAVNTNVPVDFGPAGTSFSEWADLLAAEAQRPERVAETDYWAATVHDVPAIFDERTDSARDIVRTAGRVSLTLEPDTTEALLTRVPVAFYGEINDILLTALVIAVGRWRQQRGQDSRLPLLIEVEWHGRHELFGRAHLSHTVGWFTSRAPVRLALESVWFEDAWKGGPALGRAVKTIKEQLRRVPDHGLGYGLLRYLNADSAAVLEDGTSPQLAFNYLGRLTTGASDDWGMVRGSGITGDSGDDVPMSHPLSLNAVTLDGPEGPQLHACWTWASAVVPEAAAREIADGWFQVLRRLVRHVSTAGAGGHSPSDFPLVSLTIDQLEQIELKIPRVEGILPVTALQQGLLFHTIADAGCPEIYVCQVVMRLWGAVDPGALQNAIAGLLARHPNLRAAFVHTGLTEPVQVIAQQVPTPFEVVDLSLIAPPEREERFAAWLKADKRRAFDLTRSPAMRFTLIRFDQERSRLVLSHHHVLIDGWSNPILVRELLMLYERRGECRGMPELPPYREYFNWLRGQDRAAARRAWASVLSGLESATRLAPVKSGITTLPAITTLPETLEVAVSEELTSALAARARIHGWTTNTLVQFAWALVLAHLTGRDDVTFGTVVSGRPAEVPGIESMLGMFINTVPVRVQFRLAERLADALTRLQRQQGELLPYQYLGLNEIQSIAALGELFDTLLAFENYPRDAKAHDRRVGSLQVEGSHARDVTHYPVTVLVAPGPRLCVEIAYRTELFSRDFAAAIAHRFQRALAALADDRVERIADVDLLGPIERQRLLLDYNSTFEPIEDVTLLDMFERRVARTPEAVALSVGYEHVTYRELDDRAARLSDLLSAAGVGRDDCIGICVDRSADMIVAVLAVMKAAAAFVPLEPAYPDERLHYILSNAGVRIAITTPHLGVRLPQSLRVLHVAEPPAHTCPTSPVRVRPLPESLVYVMYTSGSTGRPKGVAMHHRALVNLVEWHAQALSPGDGMLQFASLGFDVSVVEMFVAWKTGGTCYLAAEDVRRDIPRLSAYLEERRIAKLMLPNAVLEQLAQHWHDSGLVPEWIQEVITGGEQLVITGALRHLFACVPKARLHNHYGPTEAHVVTAYTMTGDVSEWLSRPPIGSPVWNTQIYVLDPRVQPVPEGVVGEVYIGGRQLARGYVNQPAVTAARFVADPFGAPGVRMYRTGDLAMRSSDGSLVYQGRVDDQVKVRGFRVELGEIETALRSQPGVRDAVVALREDRPGEKRLIAYIDADAEPVVIADTRNQLAKTLPDYMVPAAVVRVDSLPLTANGKVDRQALPAPALDALGPQARYRAPRTPVEEILCEQVARVLRRERVGLDDDFFALGGDSLRAMELTGHFKALTGLDISIRDLFEAPTVGELVGHVGSDPFEIMLPIRVGREMPPLFCIHPQWGLSWSYRALAPHLPPDRPIYGVQSRGIRDATPLPQSVTEMAAEYLEHIRRVQLHGPYYLIGWSFGGLVAHALATLLQADNEQVDLLAMLDSYVLPATTDPRDTSQDLYVPPRVQRLPPQVADRLIRIATNNLRVMSTFLPVRYEGDLVLFVAAATAAGTGQAEQVSPDAWSAHITGTIRRHDISVTHNEMLERASSAAEIGRLVAQRLNIVATAAPTSVSASTFSHAVRR